MLIFFQTQGTILMKITGYTYDSNGVESATTSIVAPFTLSDPNQHGDKRMQDLHLESRQAHNIQYV